MLSPTAFIALVKAIAYGWQQEKLAANAQSEADNARELFERIKSFGGHLTNVGDGLGKAVDDVLHIVPASPSGRTPGGLFAFEVIL
jgi:DNA anti-recombination protein RmuC